MGVGGQFKILIGGQIGPRAGGRLESPLTDRGRRTWLWYAWLAWSQFRVVIPVLDKTLPTVASCLDSPFWVIGGVPTVLTDNETTVTVEHVARIPVRNVELATIGRFYALIHR